MPDSQPPCEHCRLTGRGSLYNSIHSPSDCPIPSCDVCPSLEKLEAEMLISYNHLVDLSKKHLSLKRLINERHDPLRRLPTEMLSEIFKFYCAPDRKVLVPNKPPLVIGAVCKHWRDVTLGTPQLWSTIEIHADFYMPYYLEVAAEWLCRSRSLPLFLSIKLSGPNHEKALENSPLSALIHLLRSHSARWADMTIDEHCEPSLLPLLLNDLENMPSDFCSFTITSVELTKDCRMDRLLLPKKLRTFMGGSTLGLPLGWQRLTFLHVGHTFYVKELVDIIERAPNLTECHIYADPRSSDVDMSHSISITSHSITSLSIRSRFDFDDPAESILDYLVLPSLDTLYYECEWRSAYDCDLDTLNCFLTRSSPHLKDFTFKMEHITSSDNANIQLPDLPAGITSLDFEISNELTIWTIEDDTRIMNNFLSLLSATLNYDDGGLSELHTLRLIDATITPDFWSALSDLFPPPPRSDDSSEVDLVIPTSSHTKSLKSIVIVVYWDWEATSLKSLDPSVASRLVEIGNSGVEIIMRAGSSDVTLTLSAALDRYFQSR